MCNTCIIGTHSHVFLICFQATRRVAATLPGLEFPRTFRIANNADAYAQSAVFMRIYADYILIFDLFSNAYMQPVKIPHIRGISSCVCFEIESMNIISVVAC